MHRFNLPIFISIAILFFSSSFSGCSGKESALMDSPGTSERASLTVPGFSQSYIATVKPLPTPAPTPDDGRTQIATGFYYRPLDDALIERITGSSYPTALQDSISYDSLRYVSVLHYNFEGEICFGEMIVADDLADEVTRIFRQLYLQEYPLTSIKLIDEFGGSKGDRASMAANNTSAFNYRLVAGTDKLSRHALGRAIDINPMMNPYVKGSYVSPKNGAEYAERSVIRPGMIDENDLCYQLFIKYGWTWGGNWTSFKDYQHFEKK